MEVTEHRRFWDATEQLFGQSLAGIRTRAKEELPATAWRLDGRPLTLTKRQVEGVKGSGLRDEDEAKLHHVLPQVIRLIREGKIFADLPQETRVLSPETLEFEAIEVHEKWVGKTWKGTE